MDLTSVKKIYDLQFLDSSGDNYSVAIHPVIYTNNTYTYVKIAGSKQLLMLSNHYIFQDVAAFLEMAAESKWSAFRLLGRSYFIEDPRDDIESIKLSALKHEVDRCQNTVNAHQELLDKSLIYLDTAAKRYEAALEARRDG